MKLSRLLYKAELLYHRTKTIVFYRNIFDRIGSASVVYTPTLLLNSEQITIGRNVLIRKGLRAEVLERPDGRKACLEIGDNVNIEQNVHIICQNRVVVGRNTSITGNCVLVDATHPYGAGGTKVGDRIQFNDDEVIIGANVFIGFGSVILPGTEIGSNSYVGAMSVVKGKFPEGSLLYGSPAKLIRSIY